MVGLLLTTSFFFGCQTVEIKDELVSTFSYMGEANFQQERKIRKDFKKSLEKQTPIKKGSVKVLIDAIPEGVSYADGVISVKEGYKHEIVGKFTIQRDFNALFWQQYWIMNYESPVANVLCNAQAPLKVLTLGIWTVYSPTYWGCWPKFKYTPEQATDDVARLAEVADGNLAITSFFRIVPSDIDEDVAVINMSGFILRIDPRMKNGKLKTSPQKLDSAQNPPRA